MMKRIAATTLLVPDYDEAIAWFCAALGFVVVEDTPLAGGKRWVVVAPPGGGSALTLAVATDERQRARIGDQTGGRVGHFLHTDDFARDHRAMEARGVRFLETARHESYGIVAVFADPWGGRWDLIEAAQRRDRARPLESRLGAMSLERQTLHWVVAVAAIAYVFYVLGSVITPFAAGIALGYFFNPIVHKLERLGLNRLGGAVLIMVLFVIVLIIALVVVAPILGRQLIGLSERLPDYAMRLQALVLEEGNALLAKYGGHWSESLGLGSSLSAGQLQKSVGDFVGEGAQWLIGAMRSLASSGASIVNFFSLLIITPVVAFYILVDWNRMIAAIDAWLPPDHRDRIRSVAHEIDLALAGFLRGQSLVCVFLGLWYGVGLTLVGLDYGFLIGILGGVLSFIPYVGSMVVFMFGLGVALVQGWPDFHLLAMTLGVVVAGQFLEAYVVSPKLVGKSVGLHPVWLMFALLAFGELFGFVGLIIAVPAAAAIGVIVRRLLALYLTGPLFRGRTAVEKAPG